MELQPISPFEYWKESRVPIFPRKIFRPLVFFLQFKILPDAFFNNHPELLHALQPSSIKDSNFLHFWSLSAILCEDHGLWPKGISVSDNYVNYLFPLMADVKSEHSNDSDTAVWLVTMPKPISVGEVFFIAMCRSAAETPSPSNRYFTFELTYEPNEGCFCEVTNAGHHKNFGQMPIPSLQAFEELVRLQLRIP